MKTLILNLKVNSKIILSFGKMEIDKEKFNKLKQLDRIEFRQKLEQINGIEFDIINFIFFSVMAFGIVVVGGALSVEINGEMHIAFQNAILNLFNFSFFLIFLQVCLMLFFHYFKRKKFEELEKEYFTAEVKK